MIQRAVTPTQQRVAITGATGFIGQHLCEYLRREGTQVRALVRNPARAQRLLDLGVELCSGDLGDAAALDALVAGCDAVIHGAGAVRGNSAADFDGVNVAGTAHLLAAVARREEAVRLVHLSSLAAREPSLSFYASSKCRGEALLQDLPNGSWIALRPPAVYGPGDTEMLAIFQTMKRGFVTVPGSPDARLSLIEVGDLVKAVVACLGTRASGVFELNDPCEGGYSWRELAGIASDVFNRPVRIWQVPGPLLNGVARANSALATLTGKAPMLTPPKLRELRHPDWVTSNAAFTAATGWRPSVDFRRGLAALNLTKSR